MIVLDDDCYILKDWYSIMCSYITKITKEYQEKTKEVDLLLTGIKDIDNKLDIQNGEVIAVLSKYVKDRNAFVTDCIFNVANNFIDYEQIENDNQYILYFDFEHNAINIAQNLLCRKNNLSKCISGADFDQLLLQKIATFLGKTDNFRVCFNDCIGKIPTAEFIFQSMFKFCKEEKKKIRFVVIEELDSLFFNSKDYCLVIKQIKRIAKCFNVPVLVLAQHKIDIDFNDDEQAIMSLCDIKYNIIPADKIILVREHYCSENDSEIIIVQGRCGIDGKGFDRCRLKTNFSENIEDDIPF